MTVKQLNKIPYSTAKTKLSGAQDVYIADLFSTNAETVTGTETEKAVTPANLAALTSSATQVGIIELATDAEALTGTDTARAVTPANLTSVLSACKVITFTGAADIGACTAVGATTDDIVVSVAGLTDMGEYSSDFEPAITVAGQIQQATSDSLAEHNFLVFLKPTS